MGEFDPTTRQSVAVNATERKAKVAYYYDPDVGSYYYGPGHPMKPQRMRMTHSLILAYDLYKHMEVYRPHEATPSELLAFHDIDYVTFLSEVTPERFKHLNPTARRFNLEEATDCPVFEGLYDFQSSCAGASIDAAQLLNHQGCDIAINWSGGLHHAKRSEASGFCYFNDAVLGIIELLKYHTRVMYIDIDVHHGDGVEEAFFLSNRVMTVSFHKFGNFFPGTGDIVDVGAGAGKYYAVNVPLSDGIDDETFVRLFKTIIPKCVERFRPEAILLQCGADSLTGDRLGNFNVSTHGHGACAEFIKSLNLPLLMVGGGGYVVKNVARAWLYETSIALGRPVSNDIPLNEYSGYYAPEHKLHLIPNPAAVNYNQPDVLAKLVETIHEHLRHLEHAPSVAFNHVPHDFFRARNDAEDPDDFDQFFVEWEGGGLVLDSEDLYHERGYCKPTQLHRRVHDSDQGIQEDRDQRKKVPRITDGMKPDPEADLSLDPEPDLCCGH